MPNNRTPLEKCNFEVIIFKKNSKIRFKVQFNQFTKVTKNMILDQLEKKGKDPSTNPKIAKRCLRYYKLLNERDISEFNYTVLSASTKLDPKNKDEESSVWLNVKTSNPQFYVRDSLEQASGTKAFSFGSANEVST